jgi:protein ImuB
MLWLALLCDPPCATPDADPGESKPGASQQLAIGWWALQFTPRVALREEAVLLEVAASRRLFGGEDVLLERVRSGATELGCSVVAWAPTAAAALVMARSGQADGLAKPLAQLLDALPFQGLTEAAAQQHTLSRLGCRTLGDVRRLPRGGLGRRFGRVLLDAMDRTYGLQPEAFEWLTLPDVFETRLELPGRVEVAEGLMFGAHRLLLQMSGWLAAKHAGVTTFSFRWIYDFHRPSDVPAEAELTIRTAEVTRRIDHFARLLREQLGHVRLEASVSDIALRADGAEPLAELSASLLPDTQREGEGAVQLLERLSARLGPYNVVRAEVRSDYRPEHVQTWSSAVEPAPRGAAALLPDLPEPTWLVRPPLRLATRGDRPLYQGPLATVLGPYRVESGWWDRVPEDAGPRTRAMRRDYYVMRSAHAGLLWVYRDRGPSASADGSSWHLQGIFG